MLVLDLFTGSEILNSLFDPEKRSIIIFGAVFLGLLCFLGSETPHRTFTHSFIALFLMGLAVYMICPLIVNGFLIGFASHLFLDILNKKPVKLFYPKGKGICFKMCYADKSANKAFLVLGSITSILAGLYFLASSLLEF